MRGSSALHDRSDSAVLRYSIRRPWRSCGSAFSTPSTSIPGSKSAAGHHRRYRREEPCRSEVGQWPGRDAHRRHRQHPDPDGRCGDRFRHGVRRARPAQSRQSPPRVSAGSTRRRGRNWRAAEQRPIFADAFDAARVVLGESGGRDVTRSSTGACRSPASPCWARIRDRFCSSSRGLLRNVKVLEEAAAGRGLFTIVPERDGIVRRVPMIMDAQGVRMPALSFEILRILGGSGTIMIKADKSASTASSFRACS